MSESILLKGNSSSSAGLIRDHNDDIDAHETHIRSKVLTEEVCDMLGIDSDTSTGEDALSSLVLEVDVSEEGSGILMSRPPLSVARRVSAAATDGAGNVLFGGGYDGSASNAVDKYTPSGIRTTLTPLSSLGNYVVAATDGAGNVLFGGGHTGSVNSGTIDRYSPDGTRTTLTPLAVARNSVSAATDGEGNVLFGGGIDSTSRTDTVERYSPLGTRTTLMPLSGKRSELAAAMDGEGNVLFGGGNRPDGVSDIVDKYTPSGARTTLTPLSVARHTLAAATDGAGNVLFGGGFGGSPLKSVSTVDKYTPSGIRSTLGPLFYPVSSLTAATDGGGNVLFGGGNTPETGDGRSGIINKYSAMGLHSTLTVSLSIARGNLASATDGAGNVLFGGGYNANSVVNTVDAISSENIKDVIIPPYTSYKFQEHEEWQINNTASNKTITVNTPNKGYIRRGGHITL